MSVNFDPKFIRFTTAGPSSLLTGLFAYWKLDEASGDAVDSLGVYTGVSTAITYGDAGKIGDCFTFLLAGGPAVYVASTGTVNARSYSLWAKRGTIASNRIIFTMVDGFSGFFIGSIGDIAMSNNEGTAIATWTGAWSDATAFHHLVFTFSGVGASQSVELFVDNVSQGVKTVTTLAMSLFCLGNGADYIGMDDYCFDGNIDEVGIWTKVLSTAEIAELYNSGTGVTYPF